MRPTRAEIERMQEAMRYAFMRKTREEEAKKAMKKELEESFKKHPYLRERLKNFGKKAQVPYSIVQRAGDICGLFKNIRTAPKRDWSILEASYICAAQLMMFEENYNPNVSPDINKLSLQYGVNPQELLANALNMKKIYQEHMKKVD